MHKRGWEFYAGFGFVVVAVAVIAPALFDADWRNRVKDIGAAIAAFAVVGASLIAYDGAVSKVRFDREAEAKGREDRRKKVILKADMAVDQLLDETVIAINKLQSLRLNEPHSTFKPEERLYTAEFRINEPAGLLDAWDALGTMPTEAVPAMRAIRIHLGHTHRILDGLNQHFDSEHHHVDPGFAELRRLELVQEFSTVEKHLKVIATALQPLADGLSSRP